MPHLHFKLPFIRLVSKNMGTRETKNINKKKRIISLVAGVSVLPMIKGAQITTNITIKPVINHHSREIGTTHRPYTLGANHIFFCSSIR